MADARVLKPRPLATAHATQVQRTGEPGGGEVTRLHDPAGLLVSGHDALTAELRLGWLSPIARGDAGSTT